MGGVIPKMSRAISVIIDLLFLNIEFIQLKNMEIHTILTSILRIEVRLGTVFLL